MGEENKHDDKKIDTDLEKVKSLRTMISDLKSEAEKANNEARQGQLILFVLRSVISILILQISCNWLIGPALGWPTLGIPQLVGTYGLIWLLKCN